MKRTNATDRRQTRDDTVEHPRAARRDEFRVSRIGLAGFMVVAGIMHFVVPRFYERIVPQVLGHEKELVFWSGIAEILCGVMVGVPRTRRAGAWVTLVLLIIVYPANIQMAIDAGRPHDAESWLAWLRLPLQVPLWRWAYRVTRP